MPKTSKEQFEKICSAVEAHLEEKIRDLDYLKHLERSLQSLSGLIIGSLKDAGQNHVAEYVEKRIKETLKMGESK